MAGIRIENENPAFRIIINNLPPRSPTRSRILKAVVVICCFLLFAFFLWRADPAKVVENIGHLGWGFLLIFAISAVRPAARSLAWSLCVPQAYRVRWLTACAAYVAGDTFGSVLPLGAVVTEPAKVALLGQTVPISAAISSLAAISSWISG